jgi:hypothetical protein
MRFVSKKPPNISKETAQALIMVNTIICMENIRSPEYISHQAGHKFPLLYEDDHYHLFLS